MRKVIIHNHYSKPTRDWTPGPQAGEKVIRQQGKSVLFESKSGGYGVFSPEWGTFYTNNLAQAGKHYSKTLEPREKKRESSHYPFGEE